MAEAPRTDIETPTRDEDEPQGEFSCAPAADILVVDDNAANLAAIEVALGDLGRRLIKAESGQEALRHLLSHDFALILLDVQMPGMDGFETARMIRARSRTRHVPIIFVTAYSRDDDEILQGYELGAVDFLFKPIVPQVLHAKARVFCDLQERTAVIRSQAQRLRELERREMERKLAMERERWESERLREENRRKDEFLAVLAHELRNPLSPIVTGIDLIDAYGIEHDGLRQIRESMSRQVHHLIRLVDDLLDISRISSGKINLQVERANLAEVIKQAVDSVHALVAENEHQLSIAGEEQQICVHADPVRLTQVIANLLNNAARYTPRGGHIRLSWSADGDDAVIRVADDGKGISSDMLERIFERFVQEDGHARGLGLGLALVHRLVEMHGGRVRAYSPGRGKGSEFVVRIPMVPPGHRGTADADVDDNQADSRPMRIVLVEDESDIRFSVKALLESWGHEVKTAADGVRGVNLIFDSKPDAAIIDIAMPGIDGYTVARRVREEFGEHGVRLIAMTGFGRDEDRARALKAGFDSHITKPARPDQLRQALRSSIHGESGKPDAQAGA